MSALWNRPEKTLGGWTVKSRMRGRLRLKLSPARAAQVSDFLKSCSVSALPGSVQLNPITNSLLILYDPVVYSEQQLIAAMAGFLETGANFKLQAGFTANSDVPGRLRLRHPLIALNSRVRRSLASGLNKTQGVRRYRINADSGSVLVEYLAEDIAKHVLIHIILNLVTAGLSDMEAETVDQDDAGLNRSSLQLSLSTAALGITSAALMGAPMLGNLALLTTLLASLNTFFKAVHAAVSRRRITVDALDSTVLILALYNRYALPAGFMVWLLNVSDLLLRATYRDSRERITEIFGKQAPNARRLVNGKTQECPLSALKAGNTAVVLSGERIPVDGTVVKGSGLIDQSVLTGEYAPVERSKGEQVFAQTTLLSGELHIEVTASGDETSAARIARIVQHSLEHRVRLQTTSEKFAETMVLPTFGLGWAAYEISGADAMLGVLNADFGTGIRIAGPLAMLVSVSSAMKQGILIKDGSVLESLQHVNAIVFDKTGTLTQDVPLVRRVVAFHEFDESRLLARVATAEQRFDHPVARAILREAETRGIQLEPLYHSHYRAGMGIELETDGGMFRVGSRRFLESEGIDLAEEHEASLARSRPGTTCIFAALDKLPVGLIELEAHARPEAYDVIRKLREVRGIKEVFLISGDGPQATARVARQLGIDQYSAEVLPQDKAAYIQGLQARGLRVAMVGDGINDAAALSQADCGISLRGAADAALDAADIVFLDGHLDRFDLLFRLSDNLTRNVRTSIWLVLAPNSLMILGGVFGVLGLASSVVLNNAFNLAASYNGLRAQASLDFPETDSAFQSNEHGSITNSRQFRS